MTWIERIILLLAIALLAGSCSPYAGLQVGTPFAVDHVTIPANAPIGFPL
jgi:hypothetical protein